LKNLLLLALVTQLWACSLPQATVRTGSTQPGLIIKGAPNGSLLFIDGLAAGQASQFDGNPKVLTVLEGVHRVEVRTGAAVIYSEKAFVSNGETHVVTVPGGTQP
jgi:hypothetical protein